MTYLAESLPVGRDLLWDVRVCPCPIQRLAGIIAGKAGYERRRSHDVLKQLDARVPDDAGARHRRVQLRVRGEGCRLLQRRELVGDEHQVVIRRGPEYRLTGAPVAGAGICIWEGGSVLRRARGG